MLDRRVRLFVLTMILICIGPLLANAGVTIAVTNPSDEPWQAAPIIVAWTPEMETAWNAGHQVLAGSETPAFQRDDLNGDGRIDEVVFLTDLEPNETKQFEFLKEGGVVESPRRAHAGMYLRGLVGPAWESDVAAYRIYWNDDTALDIFGKTKPMLSLAAYASGRFNYHVESEYGLDVLKVGKALGVGGFGVWLDGKVWKISDTLKTHFVRADGPLRAVLEVQFVDWYTGPGAKKPGETGPGIQRRFDLTGWLSIVAGQYWGQADLRIHPIDKGPIPEIVTGVVKHEDTELTKVEELGILGRWGHQALGDLEVPKSADLGLGVIVEPKDVVAYGEDEVNSYVRLETTGGRVSYRYHGSWVKEPGGAKSTKEYEAKLRAVARLRPQVRVEVRP